MYKKQVNREAYNFDKYLHLDRWSSYFFQIKEVINLSPDNVLEIGVGDGVFGQYIKNNTKMGYKSLDIAEDLNPDYVGSVCDIPVKSGVFDLVCAFQVLEHLPYRDFEKALMEMRRVTSNHVIISLPHFGPPIKFMFKFPFIPEIKIAAKLKLPLEHTFNGQHYWEIGKKGYSERTVRQEFEKHFRIIKEFVPFENQYHRFFILKK